RQASPFGKGRAAIPPPDDLAPQAWLREMFPDYVRDFAPHHDEFWEWVWGIKKGRPVHSFVAIWPRGGAKSTSAELAFLALAARAGLGGRSRPPLWVVCIDDSATG